MPDADVVHPYECLTSRCFHVQYPDTLLLAIRHCQILEHDSTPDGKAAAKANVGWRGINDHSSVEIMAHGIPAEIDGQWFGTVVQIAWDNLKTRAGIVCKATATDVDVLQSLRWCVRF